MRKLNAYQIAESNRTERKYTKIKSTNYIIVERQNAESN